MNDCKINEWIIAKLMNELLQNEWLQNEWLQN